MDNLFGTVMLFMILFLLLALGGLAVFVLSPNNATYENQGCSFVKNISENRTVTVHYLVPMGKVMMPMTRENTEYRRYLVCLNGSVQDAGWM